MRLRQLPALGCSVFLVSLAQAAEIGVSPTLGPPRIVVTRQAGAHIMRDAEVALAAGVNRLSFDFARVGVDLATGRLSLVAPPEGVRLIEQRQPPGEASRMIWVIQAAQAGKCKLRLTYGLKGLETSLAYTAMLRPGEQTLDFEAQLVVRNGSAEHLLGAQVVLPSGQRLTGDLWSGQTVSQRLFRCEKAPYESRYLYDATRFGNTVHVVLRLPREGEGELNTQSLPAGPLRVYAPAAGGLTTFVAEVALPYRPPHETVDLDLGPVQELTVTRTRVRGEQVNVKTDMYRRVALFDLEEQFDLVLESRRSVPITLRLQEHVAGSWEMLKQSHPGEKLEAGTLEFVVPLQPAERVTVSYTVRRLNVEP